MAFNTGAEDSVRKSRPLCVITAAIVSAVGFAGCGGHDSGGSGPTAHPTAPPQRLKVVSVKPHKLTPMGTITVTYASALSEQSPLPTLNPALPGNWTRVGSTAVFTPSQAYPPDTRVTVKAAKTAAAKPKTVATRKTPTGSLLRAEQILARLHFLPLKSSAAAPATALAEAAAVYQPPAGKFTWRYPNVPDTFKQDWRPGQSGELLRGAVIAFQHQHNLPMDALIGENTWQALIQADLDQKVNTDHYSYVSAELSLPQQLSVWVDGHTVLTSPVNGGVAGAPTPLGTYPVYDRYTSTTMSGTNPSGSTYSDPGVPWVNYFTGGSAVHGFPRASYGSPQSVGCLELPISTAKQVYGLIDYGTLVHVAGPHVAASTGASPAPPTNAAPPAGTKPKHH